MDVMTDDINEMVCQRLMPKMLPAPIGINRNRVSRDALGVNDTTLQYPRSKGYTFVCRIVVALQYCIGIVRGYPSNHRPAATREI